MKEIINYNDYKSWFNKIIYAPNSTGKTRLSYEIYNNYKNNNKLLFTSKEIDDLLKISLSKKKIYVGLTASQALENDYILNELKNNSEYKNIIKKYWGKTSAKELKNSSAFFSYLNITSLSFEKYFLNIITNKDFNKNYDLEEKIEDLINYDKIINLEVFNEIKKYIVNEDFRKQVLSIDDNINNTFTSEELTLLNTVKDIIVTKNLNICPICGQIYSNNDELLKRVNDILKKIVINDSPDLKNRYIKLWRKLKNIYNGKLDNISFNKDHIITDLIDYNNFCIRTFNGLHKFIIKSVLLNENDFIIKKDKFLSNSKKIEDESEKFESNSNIYDDIKTEFDKLISLPSNCSLQIDNKDFIVVAGKEKIEITNLLSESEKKRFALIILKAYIKNLNIELVILDDPIDSYDDYYSEEASNYIANIINQNNINWVVLTHMYEFIVSISQKIKTKIQLIAYFYDPTYKIKSNKDIGKKTPLIKRKTSLKKVTATEEIIMINNLLKSKENDKMFVLLATFSIIRTLVKEVNSITKINYKESKVKKYTDLLEERYLHYSSKEVKTKIIIDLYKKIFPSFSQNIIQLESINQNRVKYYSLRYENIKINDEFIKYILYMLFKIEYLKYLFEEKIYKIMEKNKVKEEYLKKFSEIHTLGRKINYIKQHSLIEENTIKIICEIFERYRTIINDYSHSYSRLYAPYLSANMKDVAMFEYSINKLEEIN